MFARKLGKSGIEVGAMGLGCYAIEVLCEISNPDKDYEIEFIIN